MKPTLQTASDPAPAAVQWTAPEHVAELHDRAAYAADRAVLWRIVGYCTIGAVVGMLLIRRVLGDVPGPVAVGLLPCAFIVLAALAVLARGKRNWRGIRGEFVLNEDGVRPPGKTLPGRKWKDFRGYDVDPHPLDARFRRLRLVRTRKGAAPLDVPLPENLAESERIVELVRRRLPHVYPGIRDRGPVEGWPLVAGLLLALAYGAAGGYWLGMGDLNPFTQLRASEIAGGPIAALAWFLVGPGWLWMLAACRLRPRRLPGHYIVLAVVLNVLGNMVLLSAAAVIRTVGGLAG